MIAKLIARITGKAESTELARLSPASTLAAQLRASVIIPMTSDEFRTYNRERSTGRMAYQLRQQGRI